MRKTNKILENKFYNFKFEQISNCCQNPASYQINPADCQLQLDFTFLTIYICSFVIRNS